LLSLSKVKLETSAVWAELAVRMKEAILAPVDPAMYVGPTKAAFKEATSGLLLIERVAPVAEPELAAVKDIWPSKLLVIAGRLPEMVLMLALVPMSATKEIVRVVLAGMM
jgi:hypothetical protein